MNSEFHWGRLGLKDGVSIQPGHLYPLFHKMLDVALLTAPETVDGLVVLTSLNDGKHRRDSKHYDDEALDLRCWNIAVDSEPADMDWDGRRISRSLAQGWARELQENLGDDYDVEFEEHWVWVESLQRKVLVPHIHAEYDPQEGR